MILEIQNLLKLVNQKDQTESEMLWHKKMFDTAIRHLEYFIEPRVSVNAQKIADANNLGDLTKQRYRTPKAWVGGGDLYWEHAKPVVDIRRALLKLKPVPTAEEILRVVSQAEIAWITRDEEKLLPKTDRADWQAVYRANSIELLPIAKIN
ncbi:hypothetical protein [Polynucleobacter sp. AP-Sving-400A-A2]|uniref:hypothetical protein n=1 Tax=Polynucleobacter sp. AP-Sving-400A-A2 TaxID=2081049 RepID=UPI001BFD78DF|nr:hypothetical protein [Polynucleobacter sp. AP-Sving-400A-A2]QWE13969.1 hypothetical protein C2758_07250 [Polynucleobacter sp. AP-Sving-400A-A2]